LGANGHAVFRTDRSVTSKPVGIVIGDEQRLLHPDRAVAHQHLFIASPAALQPNPWHFLAATCEKTAAAASRLKLWVNGELVRELTTGEMVDYPTGDMWLAIGATDYGTWQNFHGAIDEVRMYSRALSQAELRALHDLSGNQPLVVFRQVGLFQIETATKVIGATASGSQGG
jgi:hypothetical protein